MADQRPRRITGISSHLLSHQTRHRPLQTRALSPRTNSSSRTAPSAIPSAAVCGRIREFAAPDSDWRRPPTATPMSGSSSGRSRTPAKTYSAKIDADDFSLDLKLLETQAVLLQGESGFSRKGPQEHSASYYYSLPHLKVVRRNTSQRRQIPRHRGCLARSRMVQRIPGRRRLKDGIGSASIWKTAAR